MRVFAGAVRVGRVEEHIVRGLVGCRKMISVASVAPHFTKDSVVCKAKARIQHQKSVAHTHSSPTVKMDAAYKPKGEKKLITIHY